jgi:hypothetical protein
MSYEKLLDDLEALQKSYAAEDADDQRIQAAEAEGSEEKEELDENGKPQKKPVKKEEMESEGDANPFAKSFVGKTEDGEDFEAIDGTELIKSLNNRIDVLQTNADNEKVDLSKSMDVLVGIIKRQGTLIKSLQESYVALANSGGGRKSVTSPSAGLLQKSLYGQVSNEEFMLKANAAFECGRITGKDLTVCDVSLRNNFEIDSAIKTKILSA